MASCAAIGSVNCSGKHKQKETRQEWLRRIKRGQNGKHLPNDLTLYICSEHFEKDCFEKDLQVSIINV